ncbi:MAG: glycosyltransferase family 4 protein [Acidimicrobiales bacterium]
MRVALIAPPWTPIPPTLYGGIELVVDELARGLKAIGHEPVLFATGDSTCPVEKHWILPHAEGNRIGAAIPELRHVAFAYDMLAEGEVDIVHDHSILGPFYAERYPQLPVVTTVHGSFDGDLYDVYSRIAEHTPVICVSNAQRQAAPTLAIQGVIHHGIDAETFTVGDGSGDEQGPYVLFLGRMAPDKGAHRAIAAARMAGIRVLMAAKMREPAERAYFHAEVEPLLGDDAVYLGEVPHERKVELLRGARALLFPIRWNEPFGMVMLEAFACGTPVLAFREGAAPEVVTDGVTGFLCDDEADMARAVGAIDKLRREDCRGAAEGPFSTRRMVEEHVDMYGKVAAAAAKP